MPVITQGRRQFIVSTQTLLGWKRFKREHPDGEIVEQDGDTLDVAFDGPNGAGVAWISGKRIEEVG